MAQQQTARRELMLSIAGLSDKSVDWKGRAVTVIGGWEEDRCSALLDMPEEVKLAALAAAVDGAAAAGHPELAAELAKLTTAVEQQTGLLTTAVEQQTGLLKAFLADHSSQTIDASKVTAEEIEAILAALEAKRVLVGDTPLEQLQANKVKFSWNAGLAEDDHMQAAAVLSWLQEKLLCGGLQQRYAVVDINRAHAAAFPKASFGMPRKYRGRADYLVLEQRHAQLEDASLQRSVALMVLEVKKQLCPSNLPQASLGFLTYGGYSNVALVYVLTDLVNGGVLFWAKQDQGALQLFQEPVAGMSQLLQQMQATLHALPDKVTGGGTSSRPLPCLGNTLEAPSRQKFKISGLQHPCLEPGQLLIQAFNKLAMVSSDDQDLKAWYPDDAAAEPLVYPDDEQQQLRLLDNWQTMFS